MIRLGLIGCGKWGKNYLKNLTSIQDCELSWVCDLNSQRLKEAQLSYPDVKYTQNIMDLLEDKALSGVVIATTPQSHFELAKEFLSKGKSALVEKPVTMDFAESLCLTNLATKLNSVLMAGYTLIYHPAVKKIKNILNQNGAKRGLYYLNMARTNALWQVSGVDVLHDLAVHDIYLSRYLLDEDPEWVCAHGARYSNETNDDMIHVILGFPNGKIASIFSSFIHTKKTREITLISKKMKMIFDDLQEGNKKIKFYDAGDKEDLLMLEDQMEPLKLECEHFVECIRERKEPCSGKKDINFVAKITEYIIQSLAKGGEKVYIRGD